MEKIKKHLTPNVLAAIILFLVTSAALYIIEYVLYARAVATVFFYVSIYPPLFILLYIIFGNRTPRVFGPRRSQEHTEALTKLRVYIMYAALAVCTVLIYYYVLAKNIHRLPSWQILALVTGVVIIAAMQRLRADISGIRLVAYALSIIYSLLLIVTVLFLLITGPTTVAGAKKVLADNGQQSQYPYFYCHCLPDSATYLLPDGTGRLGAYLFSDVPPDPSGGRAEYTTDAVKNGVYVDVESGDIIGHVRNDIS